MNEDQTVEPEVQDPEPPKDDEPPVDQEETPPEPEPEPEEDDGEVYVSIGDEPPEDEEGEIPAKVDFGSLPPWVKPLRRRFEKKSEDVDRLTAELADMKDRLAQYEKKEEPQIIDPGPMPTMEDCDYDSDLLDQRLQEWKGATEKQLRQKIAMDARQQELDKMFQAKIAAYEDHKQKLKVKDYDTTELQVNRKLDPTQRGIILNAAANSALLFYALGKNKKKLDQMAGIKDPAVFAFEAGKLEKELKVTSRKPQTKPEKMVTDAGSPVGAGDGKTLDRLRDEDAKKNTINGSLEYRRRQRKLERKRAG